MCNICILGSNDLTWETCAGVASDERAQRALFFLSFPERRRGVRNAFYFYSSCFRRVKGYGLRSLIKNCASLKKRNSLSCAGSARWEINSCLWLYVTISSTHRHINIQIYVENGYIRLYIQTHAHMLFKGLEKTVRGAAMTSERSEVIDQAAVLQGLPFLFKDDPMFYFTRGFMRDYDVF